MTTRTQPSYSGKCDLHKAVESGSLERVQTLVAEGADVNAICWIGSYNWTPLMLAADLGHVEIARFLLEQGASAKTANLHGGTILIFALCKGHLEIADMLLQAGADVHTREPEMNSTTLMTMMVCGPIESMRFLLEHGVDVNARDKHGRTALNWAEDREPEVIELLKQWGATL